MADVRFSALVRGAFGGNSYAHRDISVSLDRGGEVLVWDPIANHYTRCHSLTESQQKRLRGSTVVKEARKARR